VIAVLLLAVVVAGGWLAYTAQNRPAPRPAVAAPTPLPSVAQAGDGVAPGGAPSPVALVSPSPSAAGGAKALPAPGAAAVKPAITPIPATLPAATPTPKVAEKPTPAPRPTPSPTAVAKAAPTAAARPTGGGYEALKAGRLAEASSGFESAALSRSAEFSVQLLVACSAQTIEKAIQNDPSPDLFILPATIGGKPCHRLMRGFFKTNAEATQAVSALPGYYVAEGAKPKAVLVKSVLR
jgi:septal ring-binding cell division protein DamX